MMKHIFKIYVSFHLFFNLSTGQRQTSNYKKYDKVKVIINAAAPFSKNIDHFWWSTGFCPPDPHELAAEFFLSQDMKLNLMLIAGLPNDAIKQVRIHWLLQLVTLDFQNGKPHFNFTLLDTLLDTMYSLNLNPGFEVMGNPSDYFRDFENATQVDLWRQLVMELATHYIGRYGLNYVRKWNFESWNEPDNHDFDNITMTKQGFLNYYDATSQGLLEASGHLHLGGPGEHLVLGRSPWAWALLQHCFNGTNFFTGETGVRLDYLSSHNKGGGLSLPILTNEILTFNEIKRRFPKFQKLPFYNDEADPLVNWIKPLQWRGDATYAAIMAKIISQHWYLHLDSKTLPTYQLLSNDNAFLSYQPHVFEQRTLSARFQFNNTCPPHVVLVQKPVYAVLVLLSYLSSTPLPVTIIINGSQVPVTVSEVGAMATIDQTGDDSRWSLSVLLYNSNDTSNVTGLTPTDIVIKNASGMDSPRGDLRAAWYVMDNRKSTNPFLVWRQLGRPVTPTRAQLRRIMASKEPRRVGPFIYSNRNPSIIKIKLPLPGVRLFHLCRRPSSPPGPVCNVQVHNVTSNLVLITWQDKTVGTKCIKTFEVELSLGSVSGPYQRINTKDIIYNTFYYIPVIRTGARHQAPIDQSTDQLVSGFYRVRSIDYWNRPGEYSKPVRYGEFFLTKIINNEV